METYTEEEIKEMCDKWVNYNGFTGETCGKCKCTANVFAGGAGWLCDCGHYNVQLLNNHNIPHEYPDMGTRREIIQNGWLKSERYKKWKVEYKHE